MADPLPTLIAATVVVVAGKGGVGKTTVTAVLARAAADSGRRVLAVELDGKPLLADLLPGIDVRSISATDALDEYLRDHGFTRVAKRLATTGVIDVISTAAPGIDDIVVLGKIKQLERSGQWDLIVVDGPAAGHAITFLTSAQGMLDSVRGGPVFTQAKDVTELLTDPERCQIVLVTLPEATPVNEVIETMATLVDRVGVRLGPVVVNEVDARTDVPDPTAMKLGRGADAKALRAAAVFRRARRAMQDDEIARLEQAITLPRVDLVSLPVAGLDADHIRTLAASLTRAAGTP
ncbi:MAG TPA: ArsA-related P-loop ATPase [Ilumatobacteraceae bacterium]|nr:ArsA-related P-loop ATPase [Ilumatobacteraceae bacterium]